MTKNRQIPKIEGGFGIVPHKLRKSQNVSSGAKLLFCALVELQYELGYCYATNNYLAEEMNTSDSTIKRWLNELADESWVKVIVDRNENNEVIERRIYINLNPNLNTFLNEPTPGFKNEPTPGFKNELYKNTNNRKRKEIYKEKAPSAPKGERSSEDDLFVEDEQFETLWNQQVQNHTKKANAYTQWKRLTRNGTDQDRIRRLEKSYLKYLLFLKAQKESGFNRRHMDMSTFLNPKNGHWCDEWVVENIEKIVSKTNQQPSHWRERLRIAIRQGLVDKQEVEISEWKYLQRNTKQVLETIDIDAIHQKEKEKELQKLYELNCVANINPYTWRNIALQHFSEEELSFRDLDDYNVPNTPYYKVWQWLVRYGESLKKPDIHHLPIKDKIQLYQHWGKNFKRNE